MRFPAIVPVAALVVFASATPSHAQEQWQNVGVQNAWWDFLGHTASRVKNSVTRHVSCLTDAENAACDDTKVLEMGDNIRSLVLPDDAGTRWSIGQLQNNKPTLLNVWATWCGPCQAEMPALQAVAQDGKYTVIALSVDKEAGKAQRFLEVIGADAIRLLSDPFGQSVTEPLMNVRAYPITFLLNRQGTIVARIEGERAWDSPPMQRELARLLARSRF